ncbi:MAG: hypothetical protein ABI091_28910 [Ferruginibacter sp.]
MKCLNFLFCHFIKYYQNENNITRQKIFSFINVLALLLFNLLSIIFIVNNFLKKDLFIYYLPENNLKNKFLIIPLFIFPFPILLYFYFRKNENKILMLTKGIDDLPIKKRKQLKFSFLIYIVISAILLLFSIISPAIFKK